MKKIIIPGAVVVVLLGAYTGLWYHNDGRLVKDAESGLAQVQAAIGPQILTYSSIKGSGFPGSPAVSVKDIKVNLMGLAELKTDAFTLKRGIFTNCISQETAGDIKLTISPAITQGEAIEWDFKTKDGKTTVSFSGNEFMNFVTGRLALNPLKDKNISLNNAAEILLNEFKSIESSSASSEMLDVKSGKALISTGPSAAKFSVERIDDTSHKVKLSYSMKDMEVSPEFDKMLASFADKLQAQTGADTSFLKFMRFSAYGKASSEIDLAYKGPTQLEAIKSKGGEFDVEIAKYESSDNMQKSSMKGHVFIKIGSDHNPEIVNVNLDGSYQATPAFQEYVKSMYKQIAQAQLDKMAETPFNPEVQQQQQIAAMLEQIFTMYGDRIFPDLAKMGPIKTSVDFKYNQGSKAFSTNVSLLTDKYGFVIRGDGTADQKKLDLEVTIKNYREFIEALYTYSKDMIEIANEVTKGTVNFNLNDKLKLKLLELLEKMGESGNKDVKDLVIHISINGDQVKVGKMTAPELVMAFMMLLPELQQAAGGPGLSEMPR